MSWLYIFTVFRVSAFCVSLLPVAGVTSSEIKRCFGVSLGIEYEHTEETEIGGRLSVGPCEKSGDGKLSKY